MRRVVIADDNSDYRFLIGLAFGRVVERGFEVVGEASTVEEAVALVDRTRPDLLLIDLSIPNRGGPDALNALCARHPDLVVVQLSSLGDDQTLRVRAAIATLEKGLSPIRLVRRLVDVIGPCGARPKVVPISR